MSYELWILLNVIIGYSEILLEDVYSLGFKDFIYDINNIYILGKYLLMIINDIFDFLKIEVGKMDVYWESVNIMVLIENVLVII